ncbi:glycosyltransferase family 61 protein [Leptolyngbya sp. PL-A3]
MAYLIRNIEIIDGHFYKGAMKYSIKEGRDKLWLNGSFEELSEAQLVAGWYGNRFFGHWIRDEVTASIIDFSPFQKLSVHRSPYLHEAGYRELFQIHSKSVGLARCRELIVFDDYSQNSFKQKRYEYFRSSLKQGEAGQAKHPGVFIRRGKSGASRTLVNESAIEEFFQSVGFTIVDQENLSAAEVMQKILGAKVVASVEGSHMAHGIYGIAEGGTFLALQPPYRFNNTYKDYADCLDVNYSFVVGEEVPNGFIVSVEDLKKTLDIIPD